MVLLQRAGPSLIILVQVVLGIFVRLFGFGHRLFESPLFVIDDGVLGVLRLDVVDVVGAIRKGGVLMGCSRRGSLHCSRLVGLVLVLLSSGVAARPRIPLLLRASRKFHHRLLLRGGGKSARNGGVGVVHRAEE